MSAPGPLEARLLRAVAAAPEDPGVFEALARFVLPGDDLVWVATPPGRALQRRLQRELPAHTSRVESARRPILI